MQSIQVFPALAALPRIARPQTFASLPSISEWFRGFRQGPFEGANLFHLRRTPLRDDGATHHREAAERGTSGGLSGQHHFVERRERLDQGVELFRRLSDRQHL